tara:strand:- start:3736 stop:3954 length:219 start_codon:yes stop_codon:yes gene_type:complete
MNQHILIAMDHENHSKEELKKNLDAADAAAAADSAVRAACYPAAVKYWVNEYFEVTGEDREEYEKALEDMRE